MIECRACAHVGLHQPTGSVAITVCRHPKILDWQESAINCRIGLHVDVARRNPWACDHGGLYQPHRR